MTQLHELGWELRRCNFLLTRLQNYLFVMLKLASVLTVNLSRVVKGCRLQRGKYRGLRLLEHGMKVREKILASRLKEVVNINETSFTETSFVSALKTTILVSTHRFATFYWYRYL